jgi:tetratricopeptide (TPR) repeat protein
MGMGRAFVSLWGDASAAFWNPAATATIDRSEFSAFHTSLFLETNYDCVALSHPVDMLGVFSISAGRLGASGIPSWDNYNRRGDDFSASEMLLGISYGRFLGYGVAVGATVKGVGQEVADNAGYGFGMDLGFQYRPNYLSGLCLGMGFNDLIQPRIKLLATEDKYQTVSRFGLSYSRNIKRNFGATVAADFNEISGRDGRIHTGLEAGFYNAFFLRLGYDHDRMTFGGGMLYNIVKLDYAYESIEYLGGSHRVSLGIAFGKSVRQTRDKDILKAVETERATWQESLNRERRSDFDRNIAGGDSLFAAGRFQDALLSYQRALVIDEASERARVMADSMMKIIIASAATGARDEKREELTSRRIEAALGEMKAGRYANAIAQYELALEIDPGNLAVADLLQSARTTRDSELAQSRSRARSYRDAGDYSNALEQWSKLLNMSPGDPEALAGIEAARIQIRANDLVASSIRAMDEGKYSRAVTLLSEALSLRADDKSVQSLLAEARAKSAPATSLTDIKANSEHWSIYLRGLENYQSGNYAQALESWESLIQYYPNNTDLENSIGQARQRLSTEGGGKQE